ncbi:rubrerythrin-like domain-containing protein [Halorientalis sp. IM1011]|nr:rubrerythrin-like domain-containing protein [Halorientalis sp. IM1011]
MYDLQTDDETTPTYECLLCGTIVSADRKPSECPGCGQSGAFQNRAFSLE